MSYLSDLTGTTGFLDRNPAINTGLKATGIGAGAYATMALVREVLDALEDRKAEKKRNKPTIGKDTIVITLPNTVKGASARETLLEYAKIHKKKDKKDAGSESDVRQARNADGTFARGFDVVLAKQSQFLGETGDKILSWSAGVGGLGAGWILMQKVHDYLKQKRLKREIAAAQKEYIDLLMPSSEKTAQADLRPAPDSRGGLFEPSPGTRAAAQDALAGLGTVGLLITAASSIITKKWLDDRFKDPESASSKPKVKNIVFKSASGDPLKCDAVDVLAYAKVASIAMEMPMEKTAAFIGMPTSKVEWYDKEYEDPSVAVGRVFDSLGLSGDDQTAWKYNPNPQFGPVVIDPLNTDDKTNGVGNLRNMLAWHPFTEDATEAQREAFQNEFMSDKWAPHRQFLARQAVNDYMNQYNNSGFGKTWIGQMLSPLFGWIGGGLSNVFANTPWGQRLMFNRMQNAARARQAAGGGAISAAQTAEQPLADTKDTATGADDKDPFAGSDFAGD